MTPNQVIQGTEYSCNSDKSVLSAKKMQLDYHTENSGNPAKSTVSPAQLKLMQLDYETSKKKFDDSPCGKSSPETDACLALQGQITSMLSTIKYFESVSDFEGAKNLSNQLIQLRKKFEDDKCGDKISVFKAGEITTITGSYSEMDKARIEADSKYQAKQKIFFGAIVLFGAVLMITMFSKNK